MPTAVRKRARLYWRHVAAAAVVALAVWVPATSAGATTNPTLPNSVVPTKAPTPAGVSPGVTTPGAGTGVSGPTVTTPLGPTRTTAHGGVRAKGTPGAATTLPAVEGYVGGSNVSIGDMWSGGSLQASTNIQVPVTFAGLLVVFVLVQWLIDHRDPRFVEAPVRREDDSVGFD